MKDVLLADSDTERTRRRRWPSGIGSGPTAAEPKRLRGFRGTPEAPLVDETMFPARADSEPEGVDILQGLSKEGSERAIAPEGFRVQPWLGQFFASVFCTRTLA